LLQTAILDRMCGPLCDAVLGLAEDEGRTANDESESPFVVRGSSFVGAAYSQIILEQLERANLFLVPLDDVRHWYRYHHLFAEVLQARLHSGATASEVTTLHQRASTWYEQQGLVLQAVQHALAAQDWERAARLIQDHGSLLLLTGQIHTVLRWLHVLPDAVVQRYPRLCIVSATGLMLTAQVDAAELRLRDAERSLQPETPDDFARAVRGNVALVRGCIRLLAGDLVHGMHLMQETVELLPETTTHAAAGIMSARARSVAGIFMATTAYRLTGDVSAASERRTVEAIASTRATHGTATLGGSIALAALQILQGRLRAAAATFAEVERLAPGQNALHVLIGSPAYYFYMGDLLREWNDLDAADGYLARGMELVAGGMGGDADVIMRGYLALARLEQARGKHEAALATLDAFVQLARKRQFSPQLIEQAAAMRAQLQLLHGNLSAGLGWAAASGLAPTDEIAFPQEVAHLTLARVCIATGQAAAVLPLLDRMLVDAEAKARMHSAIKILVLHALALHAHGDAAGALTTLKRALSLAAPESYVRVFVDEGPAMAELLGEAQRHSIVPDYAAKLLAAFGVGLAARDLRLAEVQPTLRLKPLASTLVEPLTDRELEILRLIAEGHSNQAIADTLVIAVSTVKRHINNLFGKLTVQSRTQALLRARALQLL
jgi:LuxR family transcriptional regulator, maltose regulon positive regulatory protein